MFFALLRQRLGEALLGVISTFESRRFLIEDDPIIPHLGPSIHLLYSCTALVVWAFLPSKEKLDAALDRLRAGENYIELVLKDWGIGPQHR